MTSSHPLLTIAMRYIAIEFMDMQEPNSEMLDMLGMNVVRGGFFSLSRSHFDLETCSLAQFTDGVMLLQPGPRRRR